MPKTTVLMLETKKGAEHGYDTKTYNEGQVYTIENSLAETFLDEGWAEEADPEATGFEAMDEDDLRAFAEENGVKVGARAKVGTIINKLEQAGLTPPENTGVDGAPENK